MLINEIVSAVTDEHCFYVFMGLPFSEKAIRKLTSHIKIFGVRNSDQFDEFTFVKEISHIKTC